jgi:hypothetical protein
MDDTEVLESPSPAPDAASTPTAAASEPPNAPSAPTTEPGRTGPSYQERVDSLRGPAREHYRRTGDLHAAEGKMPGRPKNSDAPPESSTGTDPGTPRVQTEPASGPGEQKKETRQDRDWKTLRSKAVDQERELTALRAKLEVYERQSAGRGASAPATPDTKPQQPADARPEPPDINAFNDPKEYSAAVKAWQAKDTEWLDRYVNQRLDGERARSQYESATQSWNTRIEAARQRFTDFDQVAFNPKLPVSFVTLGLLQSMPDGELRSYALGKNIEEATRIAELTHIPGEAHFKSYAEFMNWVRSDPNVAMFYGQKLALAQMELAKLSVSASSAPPKEQSKHKPLKEVFAAQPRPSAEVNVEENAAPVGDSIANALDIAKRTGDATEYKRLMNERDRQARAARQPRRD